MKAIIFSAIICIVAAGCARPQIELRADEAARKVDVMFDGRLFTSYIYPDDLEKPVLYPIYTASGTFITRGFPRDPRPNERVDHPHHVGLWFNFGDVNGLDFWNNSYAIPADKKPHYGSIRHREILEMKTSESEALLRVAADWVDNDGNVILTDETSYIFRGNANRRIIERTTTLTAVDTAIFTDNKEGLIAIRVDRAFEEPSDKPDIFLDAHGNPTTVAATNNEGVNGAYRNDSGLQKGDVWGKPARWVCLSAESNAEPVSIAIVDHESNPGYPAHSHARGYGLFAANNMGSQVFDPSAPQFHLVLQPGQSVAFRHTVVIQNGKFLSDEDLAKF
ncbi:MAG: PmoA family protein [Tannerellaceae bacterium]|nr:PmoA family protein [Tannerellaceae bacterium]